MSTEINVCVCFSFLYYSDDAISTPYKIHKEVKLETKTYCDASVQVTPDVNKGTCRRAHVVEQGTYREEIKEEQKSSQTNMSSMSLGDRENLRVASVVPLWFVDEMALSKLKIMI